MAAFAVSRRGCPISWAVRSVGYTRRDVRPAHRFSRARFTVELRAARDHELLSFNLSSRDSPLVVFINFSDVSAGALVFSSFLGSRCTRGCTRWRSRISREFALLPLFDLLRAQCSGRIVSLPLLLSRDINIALYYWTRNGSVVSALQ